MDRVDYQLRTEKETIAFKKLTEKSVSMYTDCLLYTSLQLPGEKIGRFYGAIRPVLQFIRTAVFFIDLCKKFLIHAPMVDCQYNCRIGVKILLLNPADKPNRFKMCIRDSTP